MALELTYENIVSLINAVSATPLTSFTLEQGGLKIVMEANKPGVAVQGPLAEQAGLAQPLAAYGNVEGAHAAKGDPGWQIKAPLVGTFYRSPEVDADPYVSEGDIVKKGQTIGIIEAMKLINEIVSDTDGVVEKILVENGQAVGYNDPLFVIRINASQKAIAEIYAS